MATMQTIDRRTFLKVSAAAGGGLMVGGYLQGLLDPDRTAAAATWGVPENTVSTEKGEVVHKASGRRLRYGALVDKAAALPVPKTVTLKDPKDFRLLGQPIARLDIPEKVNGSAGYGIDVK